MKLAKIILAFSICIIIQIQLARLIPIVRIVPVQLLLISLVLFCLDYDWFKGLLAGVAAGILLDILSGSHLGIYLLSYGIIGMFIGMIQPMIYKEEFLPRLFVIFIVTIIIQVLNYQIVWVYRPNMMFWHIAGRSILPGAFMNCAIAVPILLFVRHRAKDERIWSRGRRRA